MTVATVVSSVLSRIREVVEQLRSTVAVGHPQLVQMIESQRPEVRLCFVLFFQTDT